VNGSAELIDTRRLTNHKMQKPCHSAMKRLILLYLNALSPPKPHKTMPAGETAIPEPGPAKTAAGSSLRADSTSLRFEKNFPGSGQKANQKHSTSIPRFPIPIDSRTGIEKGVFKPNTSETD